MPNPQPVSPPQAATEPATTTAAALVPVADPACSQEPAPGDTSDASDPGDANDTADTGPSAPGDDEPGAKRRPPRPTNTCSVNDSNIAVGFYTDAAGVTHGYRYNIAAGTFSANIDDPSAVGSTTAAAINNAGEIAGFYTDAAGNTNGFVENGGFFSTIDVPGAMDTSLLGLNNKGEAVGFDVERQQRRAQAV